MKIKKYPKRLFVILTIILLLLLSVFVLLKYPYKFICLPEGGTWISSEFGHKFKCCGGLETIDTIKPDAMGKCPVYPNYGSSYCTKCGDSICKAPENKCNCPQDCK